MRRILSVCVLVVATLGTCGIEPIKPIPPVGCKDLIAKCVCNDRGRCQWVWECVPQ